MSSKLSLQELQRIYMLREQESGIREIARKISRAPSTVSREVKRGKPAFFWEWDSWSRARYSFEQRLKRRSQSRKRSRLKSQELRNLVYRDMKNTIQLNGGC